MKKRTMVIIAGVMVVAGGAAAIAAVGDKRGRHGNHGPHGMGFMMGEMGGFGGRGGAQWLKRLDANNDGTVTIEEALQVRAPAFARLDTNNDGVIDAQELEAENKLNVDYYAKVMLKRFDKDGDGKISREEFAKAGGHRMAKRGERGGEKSEERAEGKDEMRGPGREGRGPRWHRHHERRAERVFERFDLNDDGVLEAAEIEAAVKHRVSRRINAMVRRLDQDGDGKITRAEFERPARERFAARDINGDGVITEDDLPPFMRGRVLR